MTRILANQQAVMLGNSSLSHDRDASEQPTTPWHGARPKNKYRPNPLIPVTKVLLEDPFVLFAEVKDEPQYSPMVSWQGEQEKGLAVEFSLCWKLFALMLDISPRAKRYSACPKTSKTL